MSGGHSLVMLKPDCVERGLTVEATARIQAAGLSIDCRHARRLSAADVAAVWSQTPRVEHPIEHAILDLRYAGREVVTYLVRSDGDPIADALRVRDELRAQYERGPLENFAHAPEDLAEWRVQLQILARGCATCAARLGREPELPLNVAPRPAIPLTAGERARAKAIVAGMGSDPRSALWQARPGDPLTFGDGDWKVLVADPPIPFSLDNLVDVLRRTFVGLDLERAVALVLGAIHAEELVVARTSRARAESLVARLRSLGARARAESPALSSRA